jgi:hypothetical protein
MILLYSGGYCNNPKKLICNKPEDTVIEFYNWYFSVIGKQSSEEYQPVFKADKNGMVTIDMEKYIQNLRKYNCSENMINREILTYQECITNIKEVKYETMLDDFFYDEFGCDFVYYYRWIHSQEVMDGVKIIETKTLLNGKQELKGEFYNFDERTKEYFYWDWYCQVILIKENETWKIDEISIGHF